MSTTFLQTKLYVPPRRASLVPRPLLIQKLNLGTQEDSVGFARKISLISAPAGFGKTTLITEWLAEQQRPVAWVALDEDDSAPQQFFNYLTLAVSKIDGVGQSLTGLLQSPQSIPAKSLIMAFISDITSTSSPFLLILDDYHLVKSAEIDLALAFLLDHMPPQMHLILTSRRDPGFPLSRLRAQAQMTEIRANDLRFSAAEAAVFLQEVMGIELTADQILALESRTEGWIAGLQMAALSMQNRDDVAEFIATFAGDDRYIVDYLVDEVLARQSEDNQSFLLQTSILGRLTGPLCDALTGHTDGRDMLDRLEQANLFVVALDNRREWYRYHHLFADVLQHNLRRTELRRTELNQISDLHRRASEWYEAHGDVGEAFRHALAARDLERAADIIDAVCLSMITESRLSRLLGWMDQLSLELIADRPWLCVCGAWANLLTGRLGNVDNLLQLSDSFLSKSSAKTLADYDQILAHGISIRAYLARWREGDIARSITLSQEALQYVSQDNLWIRSTLSLNLGNGNLVIGELKAAAAFFDESQALAQQSEMYFVALAAASSLGEVQAGQGSLHQAAKTCRQAIQLGTEWGGGQPLPATGYAHITLGQVLYEWNELDEALIQITRGIELGEQTNGLSRVQRGTLTLFELKRSQGDLRGASEALDRVQELLSEFTRAQVSSQLSAHQAQLWLAQGNLTVASTWAKEHETLIGGKVSYERMPECLALSRVLIALGREQPGESYLFDASSLLAQLLEKAEASSWAGNTIMILALQAIAFHAQGEMDQAVLTLKRALSLGEPEGYTRTFVNEGAPMAFLLKQLEGHRYAAHLLTAFADPIEPSTQSLSYRNHSSQLVEPLSERELEVLYLMADGLKYKEIAEQLIVSLNTVRSHIKNIYGKLGVNNRTQAIAKASELELL
jgi:LuxR family maltose regulon positive regulatory protein